MKMTNEMLQTLAYVQDAIMAAFADYGLDTSIEIDDAAGFMEMVVDVEFPSDAFHGDVTAQLSINLETGKLIIGEDSEETVDDVSIWRWIAFDLARQAA